MRHPTQHHALWCASLIPSHFVAAKDFGVTFVKPTGERISVRAPIGDSMLEVAHANGIDIEGACGGETACSTCHIILDKSFFDKLPQASEEEEVCLLLISERLWNHSFLPLLYTIARICLILRRGSHLLLALGARCVLFLNG